MYIIAHRYRGRWKFGLQFIMWVNHPNYEWYKPNLILYLGSITVDVRWARPTYPIPFFRYMGE